MEPGTSGLAARTSDYWTREAVTNNLYTFLFSPIRATRPAHLILLDFINLIIQYYTNYLWARKHGVCFIQDFVVWWNPDDESAIKQFSCF
jgi:hypothetical protein